MLYVCNAVRALLYNIRNTFPHHKNINFLMKMRQLRWRRSKKQRGWQLQLSCDGNVSQFKTVMIQKYNIIIIMIYQ